ncbi:MAG: cytochrome c [Pseudomonadota bacterium]|nr:cytochrome c [Pseudomonadota bacterium]
MTLFKYVIRLLILSLISIGLLAQEAKIVALDENSCGPSGNLRGNLDNGKILHREHCADCHGLTGAADVVVMHMDETPHDQRDTEYMQKLTDAYLYIAVCRGGAGIGKSVVMSPWGDFFSDQEIKDLIAWMRTFSGT